MKSTAFIVMNGSLGQPKHLTFSTSITLSVPKPSACSSRDAATSDGISGVRPYFTRMRSPESSAQSNFGAVPPGASRMNLHAIDCG